MNRVASVPLDAVRAGDKLVADAGFTCIEPGAVMTVALDERGLFVACAEGRHYLDGQEDEAGLLIGLTRATDARGKR